jgi:hypothetical protein
VDNTTKQVLLIIGCIVGAFLGGYLAAVADISYPLTGHDLTGMAGAYDSEPRAMTGEDYFPLFAHMMLGIGLLTYSINNILKMLRGSPLATSEKFRVFAVVCGLSWVGIIFLGVYISPETLPAQKSVVLFWTAGLTVILLSGLAQKIFSKKGRGG